MNVRKTLAVSLLMLVITTSLGIGIHSAASTPVDSEAIMNVANEYFTLRYDSNMDGIAREFGHLFAGTPDAQKTYRYHFGSLKVQVLNKKLASGLWPSYDYHPEVQSLDIAGNQARLVIRPLVSFPAGPVTIEAGDEVHEVLLRKTSGEWLITEDYYTNELTKGRGRDTDWDEILASLPEAWEHPLAHEADSRAVNARLNQDSSSGEDEATALSSYRTYNRSAAVEYAYNHTATADCCAVLACYNDKFKEWASDGWDDDTDPDCSDCQNFVSQCIWYGFGGQDTTTAIDNHYLPMIDNVVGAQEWWCDSQTASYNGSDWPWTYVTHFSSMVRSNWQNDDPGVQAGWGRFDLIEQGDVLYIYDNLYGSYHTHLVTWIYDDEGDGIQYGDIYLSAHTCNKENMQADVYDSSRYAIYILFVQRFKNP